MDGFGRDLSLEGSQRALEALEGWKARAGRAAALDVGSWAEAECPHEQTKRAVQLDAESVPGPAADGALGEEGAAGELLAAARVDDLIFDI